MNILSVGIGGVIGALARYYIYVPLNSHSVFPWGTLTVNLLGSFLLAFFLTVALRHFYQRSLLVLGVSTGFIGAFTTFSSVSVEAVQIIYINPLLCLAYIMASFLAGLLLAFSGRQLGVVLSVIIDEKIGKKEASGVE